MSSNMNVKNPQSSLWYGITKELDFYNLDFSKQFDTPQAKETQRILENMTERFEATLTADQQAAFTALMEIADYVKLNYGDRGIALGMYLAHEVLRFIKDPAAALRAADDSIDTVPEILQHETEALESYFKRRSASPIKAQCRMRGEQIGQIPVSA